MNSFWSESCQLEEREALCGDIKTEIAVIGAGESRSWLTCSMKEKESVSRMYPKDGFLYAFVTESES